MCCRIMPACLLIMVWVLGEEDGSSISKEAFRERAHMFFLPTLLVDLDRDLTQVLAFAGFGYQVFEYRAGQHVPVDNAQVVFQAGHQTFDSEPPVLVGAKGTRRMIADGQVVHL